MTQVTEQRTTSLRSADASAGQRTGICGGYFTPADDLARCGTLQHAGVWLIWLLANRRRPQAVTARPRWRELLLCWLLHHAAGLIMVLATIRERLSR